MKLKILQIGFFLGALTLLLGCDKDGDNASPNPADPGFFSMYNSRDFEMGFSTWPYSSTIESVSGTYEFIANNADVYSEHIDANIPWNAWINGLPLPTDFTNDIQGRASRTIEGAKLTVSVSLLNSSRDNLAADYDGTTPDFEALNDTDLEDAYFQHLQYIANQLNPDYLILAIEVNELLKNAPEKWVEYKLLMANVRSRIEEEFPTLLVSESITLHNFYEPDVQNPETYIDELVQYANSLDFVTISFYPFFKGLKTKAEFQQAFDFLNENITQPIAFAETSHLSEDLEVESFDLFIDGNQTEQNAYLESLFVNAQEQGYIYVIWWAHRDYNELWETFPEELQDLGKLWISTGLIDEDGTAKRGYATWETVFSK